MTLRKFLDAITKYLGNQPAIFFEHDLTRRMCCPVWIFPPELFYTIVKISGVECWRAPPLKKRLPLAQEQSIGRRLKDRSADVHDAVALRLGTPVEIHVEQNHERFLTSGTSSIKWSTALRLTIRGGNGQANQFLFLCLLKLSAAAATIPTMCSVSHMKHVSLRQPLFPRGEFVDNWDCDNESKPALGQARSQPGLN